MGVIFYIGLPLIVTNRGGVYQFYALQELAYCCVFSCLLVFILFFYFS